MADVDPSPLRGADRLGSADLYMRHLDGVARRGGDPGNVVLLAYELDGHPDVPALRAAVQAAAAQIPLLTAGCPSWPGARWIPQPGARVELEEHAWAGDLEALLEGLRTRPMPRIGRAPLDLHVALGEGRSAVVLRFLHPLGDGGGLHLLCRQLSGELDVPGVPVRSYAARRADDARGHGAVARFLAGHVAGLLQTVRRLVPWAWSARPDRSDPGAIRLHRFSRAETAAIDARAREARLLGGSTALLAGVTAAAVVRAAGLAPWRRLWVPIPASTRSREDAGPWLSNALSGAQLCLRAGDLATLDGAMDATIRAWRGSAGRLEHVVSGDLLTLARWLPPPLFDLLLRGPALREPTSMLVSYVRLDPGEGGLMFGRPCRRAVLVGTAPLRPGLGALWSRVDGRLEVAVTTRGNRYAEPLLRELVALLAVDEAPNVAE